MVSSLLSPATVLACGDGSSRRHEDHEICHRVTESTEKTTINAELGERAEVGCDSTGSTCGAGRSAGQEPEDMNQARSFIGSYLLVRGLRPPLRGAASNRLCGSVLCGHFLFVRLRALRVFVTHSPCEHAMPPGL